ncbi:MAG: hypothetical protein ACKN9U_00430, partial [Pirellulaceae bacterium]
SVERKGDRRGGGGRSDPFSAVPLRHRVHTPLSGDGVRVTLISTCVSPYASSLLGDAGSKEALVLLIGLSRRHGVTERDWTDRLLLDLCAFVRWKVGVLGRRRFFLDQT